MATPLAYLLMANRQEQPTKTPLKPDPPLASNRGRKPMNNKDKARKKIPQRGMGVAQLERLRLQENFKTIQESTKLESFSNVVQPSHSTLSSVPDPIHSFPVHYAVNYGGVPPFVVPNPYVKVLVGNESGAISVYENSIKELSSIPKLIHHYQPTSTPTSDFWFKNFNGEKNTTTRTDQKFPEITPLRSNLDLNHHPNGFEARAARSAIYHHNFNDGTEASAIHRKPNKNSGNMVMEYDFFPSDKKSFKEMEFGVAESSVGAASCLTYSDHSGASSSSSSSYSNSIDLSLKLSY
ncbi:uncharacterized protein LOC126669797 isoform X2 [Mercurialis annua]|uniref:uncharacterized protein LOC126669797 isoform X2 n=1 Tax=Mercurialis annua TaxID=3986 RepID=UPI00215E1FBC|nr:uncharacterized protein LOC126669797 isoform X2 [Mercurialis annua]